MMYAFPLTIAAMLLYMFWHAGYSMRKDRISHQRSLRRQLVPVRIRSRQRR